MNAIEKPVIIRNSNVSLIEGRGRERIYRVLAYNDSHVHVVELGTAEHVKSGALETRLFMPNRPSKKVRNRLKWSRSFVDASLADGTLVRVAEHGIPEQMAQRISPSGSCPKLDIRRNVVAHIERYWGDTVFEDRAAYAKAIRTAANRFNSSENATRKWFEMHIFYGRHENALVDHDWRKGAPGVSRRDLRDEHGRPAKLGRRTASEKMFPKSGHKRKRLTKQLAAEYSNFLRQEAFDNNDPFPVVYRRWVASRVAFNRDKDGVLRIYQIDPKNFPGDDNMKRVGRNLLKKHREDRDKVKRLKPGNNGGSAQDIVHDQLPVLDIDGTVASNFILFGDEHVKIDGQGKPTVLLAVDRGSLAIVGWHVSFGPENGDAYLSCVFSACTPKTRELHRWGVPHLGGMVYGCTSEVFIDRGPGISMRTQSSLVDRFRTAVKMAEPGSPQSKGHAEQVMKYFQEELAYISGSTFKTGDTDEDRKRQKHARNGAIPLKQFMQALLMAISRRNLELDAGHLLTADMMKHQVAACPAEIYRYNKNRRRGDAAWDWAPEDVFRKLCIPREQKAPKGIVTLDNRKYTSSELQLYARSHAVMHNDASVKIKTYEIPSAPFVLLWELPGQGLGLLEATESTRKIFEDGLGFSIDYQNDYRNHLRAEAKFIARKHAMAAINEARGSFAAPVSKAQQKKIDSVESNAAMDVPMNMTAEAPRTQARRRLERQNVDSIISEFSQVPLSEIASTTPIGNRDKARRSIDDTQDLSIEF